jgi:hypothetical protein
MEHDPKVASLARAHELSAVELTKLVVAIARDVARAKREEDYASLSSRRDEIRRAIPMASATNLWLLEVAEAFLAYALPGLRPEAEHVRVIVRDETGASILDRMLKGEVVGARAEQALPAHLRGAFASLHELGVVVRNDDRLEIAARFRALVRDEMDPLAFRLWRRVQDARARVAWIRDGSDRARALAGLVGVTTEQATLHLQDAPFPVAAPRRQFSVRWRNPGHPRVEAQQETRQAEVRPQPASPGDYREVSRASAQPRRVATANETGT